MAPVLYVSVFIIATCGLIYELAAGAIASYILGDSITQFSLIIGVYLSSMGLGSYLSRFIEDKLLTRFIEIELAVGLVGGCSAGILFLSFQRVSGFQFLLYLLVVITGTLVGLEIPLLIRILEDELDLKEAVSRVLSLDYIGALVASLVFPILLLPKLGLVRTGLFFGLLNAVVGLWGTFLLPDHSANRRRLRLLAVGAIAALVTSLAFAERLVAHAEARLFHDEVILKATSPYQKLVITRWKQDIRLFINNNLQFSSLDEYRYHEALVHPAAAVAPQMREVLVLGGGDGFAVREVLRYPTVEKVVLVDLDPKMTEIFTQTPFLAALNKGSLNDPRVEVVNADAFKWAEEATGFFDLIVADFPDPNNHALGKLYTTTFYRMIKRRLSERGVMVVQSSSPYFTPMSFWSVVHTLEAEGMTTRPFHAYVPSFGEWGFVIAANGPIAPPEALKVEGLRFLSDESLPRLFSFPPDMARREAPVNRLNNQILVQIYAQEWGKVL